MEVQELAHSLAHNFLSIIQIFNLKCLKVMVEGEGLLPALIAKKLDMCLKTVLTIKNHLDEEPPEITEMMDGIEENQKNLRRIQLGEIRKVILKIGKQVKNGELLKEMNLEELHLTTNLVKMLTLANPQVDGAKKLLQEMKM